MPTDRKLIQASRHFTHYAVQFRVYIPDRDCFGAWEHFELSQGEGEPNLLAIYKHEEDAKKCQESIGQIDNVETRVARYHTSGYTDCKDAPPLTPTHMWDAEPEEPTRQEKARQRAKTQEIEIID